MVVIYQAMLFIFQIRSGQLSVLPSAGREISDILRVTDRASGSRKQRHSRHLLPLLLILSAAAAAAAVVVVVEKGLGSWEPITLCNDIILYDISTTCRKYYAIHTEDSWLSAGLVTFPLAVNSSPLGARCLYASCCCYNQLSAALIRQWQPAGGFVAMVTQLTPAATPLAGRGCCVAVTTNGSEKSARAQVSKPTTSLMHYELGFHMWLTVLPAYATHSGTPAGNKTDIFRIRMDGKHSIFPWDLSSLASESVWCMALRTYGTVIGRPLRLIAHCAFKCESIGLIAYILTPH